MNPHRMVLTNGQKIVELRKEAGMSQDQLAAKSVELKVDFCRRTLVSAEKGGPIKRSTLESIAKVLGCAAEAIMHVSKQKFSSSYECQSDFIDWVKTQKSSNELLIQSIAIDMSYGREHLFTVLNQTNISTMRLELLVLTGNGSDLPKNSPPSVRAWSTSSGGHLSCLQEQLAGYKGEKRLIVQVKQYCSLPTLHGLRLDSKTVPVRYYLSECRYSDSPTPSYEAGEGQYSIFKDDDKSELLINKANRFDNLFFGLWTAAPEFVLDFDSHALKLL